MIYHKSDDNSINLCSQYLSNEKVVILPTDTVYGFSAIVNDSADFSEPNACPTDKKIRDIKGRSEKKPFIQLIASPEDIYKYTSSQIPQKLFELWPGPLTVIVKDIRLAGKEIDTTAFRCPGDAWLRKIIGECGKPLYSTSVNRSGFPVLDTEDEIVKEFSSDVDLIVLDGDKKNALPSTIIKIEDGDFVILRQGSLSL